MSADPKSSTKRAAILGRVRANLGVSGQDPQRLSTVSNRLDSRARNTVPSGAKGDANTLKASFTASLETAQASVVSIASMAALPEAVTDYLKRHNLPQRLRMGDDDLLAGADWSKTPHLERKIGPAEETDQTGLACAFAGIAETGTLMLTSGTANPTTSNFLPEDHIIVLPASRLHGAYEDAWDALRDQASPGEMPRTVNYVSGPSRTGDIEQKLLLGAHGPRRLHIIFVENN